MYLSLFLMMTLLILVSATWFGLDLAKRITRPVNMLAAGARLSDVVKALNSLGATPQDLLAILQAMKSAGALNAELEVI